MPWFAFAIGGWAMAMLVLFIMAIRLSYRIEARSMSLRNTSGIARNAMIFHTILNIGVAMDAETQAMRRQMLMLLVVSVTGVALMGYAVSNGLLFSPLPAE